jgi:hypothetical protein
MHMHSNSFALRKLLFLSSWKLTFLSPMSFELLDFLILLSICFELIEHDDSDKHSCNSFENTPLKIDFLSFSSLLLPPKVTIL